jgi:hypothetical protein
VAATGATRCLRARALGLLQLMAAPPSSLESKYLTALSRPFVVTQETMTETSNTNTIKRVVRELTLVLQSAGGIADTTDANLLLREGKSRTDACRFDFGLLRFVENTPMCDCRRQTCCCVSARYSTTARRSARFDCRSSLALFVFVFAQH